MTISTNDLQIGQTWTPTRTGSRAKSRTIVWTQRPPESMSSLGRWTVGFVHDPGRPTFSTTGHDSYVCDTSFLNWVRKHQAVKS